MGRWSRFADWPLAGVALVLGLPGLTALPHAAQVTAGAVTWTRLAPAASPPARAGAAMTYGSAAGSMLLFGGRTGSGFLGDTWTWNGSGWARQDPAVHPAARSDASMAYDAAAGTTVLFGGGCCSTHNPAYLGDTWTWNGSGWAKQDPLTSPSPRAGGSMAYDPATGDVILFGGLGSGGSAFLNDTWAWNGAAWSQLSPATSPPARLDASMAYDAASGNLVLFGGVGSQGPLRDTWRWNGSDWQKQNPATSPSARSAAAAAYDSATRTIVIFGGLSGGGGQLGDTWTWNGSSWARQALATSPPARAGASMAYDAASGHAILFGGYHGSLATDGDTWAWGPPPHPLDWTIQSAPGPYGSTGSVLLGVSCRSPSDCMAVGTYITSAGTAQTLAEQWNGTSWAILSTPSPSGGAGSPGDSLNSVSCASADSCLAVGYEDSEAMPLAERWDGTSWTVQPPPAPPNAAYGISLSGVSCSSVTACTAVGSYTTSAGVQQTLAERWSGNWAIEPTPSPHSGGAGTGSELSAVSCPSATACTAAGDSTEASGGNRTLAERWDGTSWTVQATPNPAGVTNPVLLAVSCASGSACTATGASYNNVSPVSQVNLAERWNGTSWALQPIPTPAGPGPSALAGASCPTAADCTAVGFSSDVTTAEQWTGSRWAAQPTPNPAASSSAALSAVSCPSATRCTAVGGGSTNLLVESYRG